MKIILIASCVVNYTQAFLACRLGVRSNRIPICALMASDPSYDSSASKPLPAKCVKSRRSILEFSLSVTGLLLSSSSPSKAAVGSLPEFADTTAILQGMTVNVADKSQQDAMINFLVTAFDFSILRKRIRGSIEETWLGFGPEQVSVPPDWTPWLSSLETYGGHASIHVVYDSKAAAPLYRIGDTSSPGDNIAYVQLGVPGYRISQMVKNGGAVLDAYGFVNVISPAGLPIRAIVGIAPDPIMFIAINCANVEESKAFYSQLGFVEQKYPFARPSKGLGQFEPPQPAKSVYMAPSKNCMGVLLLPSKRNKKVSPNPVVQSLNIVYTPSQDVGEDESVDQDNRIIDPSGLPLRFQSVKEFETEEQATR